ncbi:MAG: WD40 repeat domain-containing protein [Treponema sp.]|nr:WD40 repeat domain-containing protein [Treponema sp.]MCL2237423.1 WD40 repeat domain-containing protein [Treponema sp.]
MAQKKKVLNYFIIILIFIVYFFIAARPIPRETVLTFNWLTSMPGNAIRMDITDEEGNERFVPGSLPDFIPFMLGNRFGYIDNISGLFALHQIKTNDIYLSQNYWTEYGAEPESLIVNNIRENTEIKIDNPRGYPVLLDNRVFVLGSDQNSISEISDNGNIRWTYDFGAPLTCIDAKAGLVLTGSLDGTVEVFNTDGERIFNFPPSGSRYSVILGCAISGNGSRIAVVCGIDMQRFLLFERVGSSGGEYKVIYHEFLETGFRRPVRVSFIDEDQRIVFEREGGIGVYNSRSRQTMFIPLNGEIAAIDESGDNGYLFLITSNYFQQKNLIGIRFPPHRLFGAPNTKPEDSIFLRAPFRSDDVFINRSNDTLVVGGGELLISFNLEEK